MSSLACSTQVCRSHNLLMDVLANFARVSNVGPASVNDKVLTTDDGTLKQGVVEISNLLISLRTMMVL